MPIPTKQPKYRKGSLKWREIRQIVAAMVLQYYIFDIHAARELTWERRKEIRNFIRSWNISRSGSGKWWIPYSNYPFIQKMAEQIINFHSEEDEDE